VATVKDILVPETKKQVRRLIRDYIPNVAEIAQPLTDLTGNESRIEYHGVRKKIWHLRN